MVEGLKGVMESLKGSADTYVYTQMSAFRSSKPSQAWDKLCKTGAQLNSTDSYPLNPSKTTGCDGILVREAYLRNGDGNSKIAFLPRIYLPYMYDMEFYALV